MLAAPRLGCRRLPDRHSSLRRRRRPSGHRRRRPTCVPPAPATPGAVNAMDVLGKGVGLGDPRRRRRQGRAGLRRRPAPRRGQRRPRGRHRRGRRPLLPGLERLPGRQGRRRQPGPVPADLPGLPADRPRRGLGRSGRWKGRTFPGTAVASASWVTAGVLWWRQRLAQRAGGRRPRPPCPRPAAAQQRGDPLQVPDRRHPPVIGLVTDSNAQLPPELAERYGVEIVPLTVTVDGDGVPGRASTSTPTTSTPASRRGRADGLDRPAQPGPVRRGLRGGRPSGGATEILSVHIGSSVSGTVNSARLASQVSPVPVRIVDTGTASFAVVAAACGRRPRRWPPGPRSRRRPSAAERVGATVGNVFVVGALDLARAGGRLAGDVAAADHHPGAHPGRRDRCSRWTAAGDLDQAAEVMAAYVRARGPSLRVGVGLSDAGDDAARQRLGGTAAGRARGRRAGPLPHRAERGRPHRPRDGGRHVRPHGALGALRPRDPRRRI